MPPAGAAPPPVAGVAERVFTDPATPVIVRAGQLFVIVVDTNPSTGYHWIASSEPDGGVVTFRGASYMPSATGLIGALGKELRIYEAVGPGSTTIPLYYMPPGTQGGPEQRATFKVTVTPADAA